MAKKYSITVVFKTKFIIVQINSNQEFLSKSAW